MGSWLHFFADCPPKALSKRKCKMEKAILGHRPAAQKGWTLPFSVSDASETYSFLFVSFIRLRGSRITVYKGLKAQKHPGVKCGRTLGNEEIHKETTR